MANDEYRARGVFKKVLNALITLEKYEFATEIVCVNLKNENSEILKEGFLNLFKRNNINIETKKIKIIPLLKMGNYAKYYGITETENLVTFDKLENFNCEFLDCKNSRVKSINGIFSCPALVNDPRGKLGEKLSDASKKMYLETPICYNCINREEKLFG